MDQETLEQRNNEGTREDTTETREDTTENTEAIRKVQEVLDLNEDWKVRIEKEGITKKTINTLAPYRKRGIDRRDLLDVLGIAKALQNEEISLNTIKKLHELDLVYPDLCKSLEIGQISFDDLKSIRDLEKRVGIGIRISDIYRLARGLQQEDLTLEDIEVYIKILCYYPDWRRKDYEYQQHLEKHPDAKKLFPAPKDHFKYSGSR